MLREIPAKKHIYRNTDLEDEFSGIYRFLAKCGDLGAFSFIYSEVTGKLYLQHFDGNTQLQTSVARIDSDGNLDVAGVLTGSVTTLENPGRG